jgi:uncharacterized short protein YbdD (DUF466 family)
MADPSSPRPLARLDALRAVLHAIIGAPDYERYVTHVRACHPERTPMTRAEFARERMEARYNRPGARCC